MGFKIEREFKFNKPQHPCHNRSTRQCMIYHVTKKGLTETMIAAKTINRTTNRYMSTHLAFLGHKWEFEHEYCAAGQNRGLRFRTIL